MENLQIKNHQPKYSIYDLHGNSDLDSRIYGIKASHLIKVKEIKKFVPYGFALPKYLVTDIALGLVSKRDLEELRLMLNILLQQYNKVIARSSSSIEGFDNNSFSGLFNSKRGITSFEQLLKEIKFIYSSTSSKAVRKYVKSKNISLPEEHLGVLLQGEVYVENSFLIEIDDKNSHVEYFQADIYDAVRGNIPPSAISSVPTKLRIKLDNMISLVRSNLQQGEVASLEIGENNNDLSIFQINFSYKNRLAQDKNYIGNNSISKAEAMLDFKEMGLFPNRLKIYEKLSVPTLLNKILEDFDLSQGITIRYSQDNKINLPRNFFTDKTELKNWLNLTHKKHTTAQIIVHPYICVRRSFELLLTKTACVLEHVPGMWESDNTLNPDVLYVDEKQSVGRVWKEKRHFLLKAVNKQAESLFEEPIGTETLVLWQSKLFDLIGKLRLKYRKRLPLNFHFVEDTNGNWFFLNIRAGFNLPEASLSHSKAHVIKNKQDAIAWDKKAPLLFKLVAKREDTKNIIDIIQKLPKVNDAVAIVGFGLLSHPAIILREFGFRLVPNYLYNLYNKVANNYEIIRFDIGLDPINRIMKEKAIYENANVKLVKDMNEITPGHLLVTSKKPYTSMVEIYNFPNKFLTLVDELKNNQGINKYFYLERGRARFCTSGFTDSHAHAHILPADKFLVNAKNDLIKRTRATKCASINDAVKKAKVTNNEYIMMIFSPEEVYLKVMPENTSVEKRLIRNVLSSNLAN